jgi:hypothetical protein
MDLPYAHLTYTSDTLNIIVTERVQLICYLPVQTKPRNVSVGFYCSGYLLGAI